MPNTDAPDKTSIFEFMMVRAPDTVEAAALGRHYVHDQLIVANQGPMTHVPMDLNSVEHTSSVGRLVYEKVFCSVPKPLRSEAMADLLQALLGLLTPRALVCDEDAATSSTGLGARLLIRDLERNAYIKQSGYYYILPDRLEQLGAIALVPALIRARPILESERQSFDQDRLMGRLEALFGGKPLHTVVFDNGGHSIEFAESKRALFDALYLLYVLRRWTRINLEHIIGGLRSLHVLEALAMDRLYAQARVGPLSTPESALLATLSSLFPALHEWVGATVRDPNTTVLGFPLIADRSDLGAYLSATPIVHPIFARLFWYGQPFNDIKPIGIGDLKVVKQWLLGYKLGEIAHIENVLQSETKSRVHRHLEKTEEVFSFASEHQEETQRDTQTTDRFELKREAEDVLKTDTNLTAGASVSAEYSPPGGRIVASVTGGFAYTRSQTETDKISTNFAHEVVDKAISRVQSRVSQQRTTTKIFETEETNTHGFDNTGDGGHISGLYRWLDKKYRSRVYNYGKRMMFEFMLPEPAAFLVESRLRAFAANLEIPEPVAPPKEAKLPDWLVAESLPDITEEEFERLGTLYDLTDFTFPTQEKRVDFINEATGNNYFSESWGDSSTWQGRSFTCRLNAKGYQVTKLRIEGYLHFWGVGEPEPNQVNTFMLYINGQQYINLVNPGIQHWYFGSNVDSETSFTAALPFAEEHASLFFGLLDFADFDLSLHAELKLSDSVKKEWEAKVYTKIRLIEQRKVDAQNSDLKQSYQSELSTYRNRLGELKATVLNDLLQGQSELFNRQVILRELKRQCLAMLTKEFDADESDDTPLVGATSLTDLDAMGSRNVQLQFHRFKVRESPDSSGQINATAAFEIYNEPVDLPAPDTALARMKGRHIQFLEQAFEWEQLAYVCYPYFWAAPPKWVELMNRSDDTDPFLSDFLQAGSTKVLLAVSPAYDDAVLHFLATGEPWEGGPAPVIGDPLYLPLHEEIRKQQDDLLGASPEGTSWTFTVPTSLVYLDNSSTPLPPLVDAE